MALRTRILTSLITAPIIVGMILGLPPGLFALFALLLMIMALWEWNRLTIRSNVMFTLGGFGMAAIAGLIIWQRNGFEILPELGLMPWISICGCLLWIWQATVLVRGISLYRPPLMEFLVGVIMLFCAWVGLVWLRQTGFQGAVVVLIAVMVVWAADSFAFFVGRTVGRRRLAPKISPGKTVEGAVGGLAGALLIAWAGAWMLLPMTAGQMLSLLVAAVAASVASIIGDLTVSRLKRQAGVKDSGNLLPGHGGLLDRIDGLLAAVPWFGTLWWWLR